MYKSIAVRPRKSTKRDEIIHRRAYCVMRRTFRRWFLGRANFSAEYRYRRSRQIERSPLLRIFVGVLERPIGIGEAFGVDHHRTLRRVLVVRHKPRLRGLPMILLATESRNLHRSNERSRAMRRFIPKRNSYRVRVLLVAVHD